MMAPDGGGERGGEAEELRVGGRLLSQELAALEESAGAAAVELATAREALGEVPLLRAALASAVLERDVLQQRSAAASATRQSDGAAAGEAGEAGEAERVLMAQLLVRMVSQGGSGGELGVLASMLGCSPEQREELGLVRGAAPRASEVGDAWVRFLEIESSR
ncbi:hypothetical protein EMIHUDRAFT_442116 [Emiliania huxleyi CCMP1516]|uniref:GRIP domain-containing protein n=3 Tax=Emiliania huxleyi TaxID=2903 RepID=A0A0D3K7F0_EMIH1|nr:hypothetical protein EMIHUDRAFT_437459 [Emiliania huxleyi CCMP1516]XP_005784114.1 hypothetical protein EMIHUDRAFT_442116 [Emiliania huxleyi CCMP1516]EOD11791.1 hypothetical protein EMIHUDRAFT_437459 [Emiliania huxleyi CCMP1516]EOD31685.1 hypothetical protein EMIHUDRAFT_442116 [Emiliania huxleyi CCMP1516]|eukprot:XP_005764220.1 hypothetical protein EMIHUDRAFT_437459 [Emiliania huxleyi CCMP1516]